MSQYRDLFIHGFIFFNLWIFIWILKDKKRGFYIYFFSKIFFLFSIVLKSKGQIQSRKWYYLFLILDFIRPKTKNVDFSNFSQALYFFSFKFRLSKKSDTWDNSAIIFLEKIQKIFKLLSII